MVLTNMLPNQGNGTYVFTIYARDREGQVTLLGTRTMTCSNATATLPFGTIDTPAQGETVSGSAYVNFGWALTQKPKAIPTDGSTLRVYVDGVLRGAPVLRPLPRRHRHAVPGAGEQQRRGRLLGAGHDDAEQRAAHDCLDGDRQRGLHGRSGQPLLQRGEWHGGRRGRAASLETAPVSRREQRRRRGRRAARHHGRSPAAAAGIRTPRGGPMRAARTAASLWAARSWIGSSSRSGGRRPGAAPVSCASAASWPRCRSGRASTRRPECSPGRPGWDSSAATTWCSCSNPAAAGRRARKCGSSCGPRRTARPARRS